MSYERQRMKIFFFFLFFSTTFYMQKLRSFSFNYVTYNGKSYIYNFLTKRDEQKFTFMLFLWVCVSVCVSVYFYRFLKKI